jgi:hypothetical protein
MKNLTTFLSFLSLIILLTSCEKDYDDNLNFFDSEYRIGLWIASVGPDKKDTLEFVDNFNLIRKGDFYVHEEYLYRIERDTLFIKLPGVTYETQHLIMAADENSVVLGNMYLTTGFADNSGMFFKDNENIEFQRNCGYIDFKYYNGTEDYLGELSNDYVLIACDTTYTDEEIRDFISTVNYFDQNYDYTIYTKSHYKYKEIPLKLSSSKTCEELTSMISDLQLNNIIAYAHYTIQTDNCENAIWETIGNLCVNSYSSVFYVKVFDETDLTDLNKVIAVTNTELVEQNEFMKRWFTLRATKNSKGDALKMANYFYETGLFEYSEPDITKYPVE